MPIQVNKESALESTEKDKVDRILNLYWKLRNENRDPVTGKRYGFVKAIFIILDRMGLFEDVDI